MQWLGQVDPSPLKDVTPWQGLVIPFQPKEAQELPTFPFALGSSIAAGSARSLLWETLQQEKQEEEAAE